MAMKHFTETRFVKSLIATNAVLVGMGFFGLCLWLVKLALRSQLDLTLGALLFCTFWGMFYAMMTHSYRGSGG